MIKVLFICHGNICRSTMAQSVFTYKIKKLGLEDARGTLFYHYAMFLEKLQPKMFLFENVWCNCFYKMISALK